MTPRKPKPKPDDKEQSSRFIKKAKEIESGNSKHEFEEAIKKIAKKKQIT